MDFIAQQISMDFCKVSISFPKNGIVDACMVGKRFSCNCNYKTSYLQILSVHPFFSSFNFLKENFI